MLSKKQISKDVLDHAVTTFKKIGTKGLSSMRKKRAHGPVELEDQVGRPEKTGESTYRSPDEQKQYPTVTVSGSLPTELDGVYATESESHDPCDYLAELSGPVPEAELESPSSVARSKALSVLIPTQQEQRQSAHNLDEDEGASSSPGDLISPLSPDEAGFRRNTSFTSKPLVSPISPQHSNNPYRRGLHGAYSSRPDTHPTASSEHLPRSLPTWEAFAKSIASGQKRYAANQYVAGHHTIDSATAKSIVLGSLTSERDRSQLNSPYPVTVHVQSTIDEEDDDDADEPDLSSADGDERITPMLVEHQSPRVLVKALRDALFFEYEEVICKLRRQPMSASATMFISAQPSPDSIFEHGLMTLRKIKSNSLPTSFSDAFAALQLSFAAATVFSPADVDATFADIYADVVNWKNVLKTVQERKLLEDVAQEVWSTKCVQTSRSRSSFSNGVMSANEERWLDQASSYGLLKPSSSAQKLLSTDSQAFTWAMVPTSPPIAIGKALESLNNLKQGAAMRVSSQFLDCMFTLGINIVILLMLSTSTRILQSLRVRPAFTLATEAKLEIFGDRHSHSCSHPVRPLRAGGRSDRAEHDHATSRSPTTGSISFYLTRNIRTPACRRPC